MERGQEISRESEISSPDTLHDLLARLNGLEDCRPVTRSEHITVEDVAEALHLDPDFVVQELEEVLREHREAKLSAAMRELEEPLYSVERTGHSLPDPLQSPLFKLRSVQILAERNKTRPQLPRRELKATPGERLSQLVGHTVLVALLILLVLFVGKVAFAAIAGR